MLFITGLLTLLAIAQAGGDHVKGGSVMQQKVAQEDIIPSPFNIKSATSPFGTKIIQQEAADPPSKTARGTALHHAVKTAASTPGKTQVSPGLHHAASSPVIQDQITIDDPASSSLKTIKTLKAPAAGKTRFSQQDTQVRDPTARSVVQTVKTVQDPVSGTKQIKTVKTVDPVIPRFSQEDKQVREPISRPVMQSVKTAEDPSASVPFKTVKTVAPSKTAVKTSQKTVESQRLFNAPLSVVEAARRTSSVAGITSNSQRGIQSSQDSRGLLLNAPTVSQIQPQSGIVNELGELILDEETLQTLQNAGGIINENGRIALNDEGIKLLQSMRGESSLTSSGISGTGMSDIRAEIPTRERSPTLINPSVNIRSGSLRTSSATAGSAGGSLENIGMTRGRPAMSAPALRSQGRFSQRSQTGSTGSTILSSNILSAQSPQIARGAAGGSVASGLALFNGKEIALDGLKEGQIFDENLKPILSDIGRIQTPANVAPKPLMRTSQRAPTGAIRSSTGTTSDSTRSTVGSSRSSGVSALRTSSNIRSGSSGPGVPTSQRTSQATGIRTTSSLTSGTALFKDREIRIDGLKEGQLFDENLRPIAPGASLSSSGQQSSLSSGSVASTFGARSPQRPQSAGLRSSTATRGTIRRTSSTLLSQPAPNLRAGPVSATVSSGLRRTQTLGGITPGGSLTSGTALFNGKEVNIDGLKEGQMFDENLRPITSGASFSSSGQISGVPTGNLALRPGARSPQISQSAGLRSSTITGTSRTTISRSRTSNALLSQPAPFMGNIPANTILSSGQGTLQATGGTVSGGSLTSGTALFNGKEITVDGLKEGQIFDENLQPILSGISGTAAEKSATIEKYGEISPISLQNAGQRTGSRLTQTGGLRSSVITSTSRGSSRLSSSLPSQTASVVRSGSLSNAISPETGISQIGAAPVLGGSLTSGTVLLNGREVSVDGLREGQIFDENLQPILPGSAGIIAEKSSAVLNSRQTSGIPSRSAAAPKPVSRSSQRLQTGTLRSSSVTSSSSRGSSIGTNARSPQARPDIRTGSLSNAISSGTGRSQITGGITSRGTLTSGSALFNGKEIRVDGLKEGQIFDENLQPILSVPSGMNTQRSGSDLSSSQIGGISSVNAAPKPGSRSAQRLQAGNLRSSAITSSSRNAISSSRGTGTRLSQGSPQRLQAGNLRSGGISRPSGGAISGARRTGTLVSQPSPAIRTGQLSSTISSTQGNTQILGGVRSSNTLTSGKVLFNGKEISLDGLKEGQLYDEKLQAITSGSTGLVSEKSANLPGPLTTGGISTVNAVPNVLLTSQRTQAERLRSSAITGSSRSGAYVASIPNTSGPQATGIVRSGGSLASGTMVVDGKEINIDGMKVGQMFDENLQPIITGTSGSMSGGLINTIGSTQTGGVPSRSIPKPRVRSGQQAGAFTSSRISSLSGARSAATIRSGSLTNTIASTSRNSQAMIGATSGGSFTSGTALFNGKEISIGGLREGQIFDENLKPILSGTSGTLPGRMSATLQGSRQTNAGSPGGAAPKPKLRSSQRSQLGASRTANSLSGTVSTSRTFVSSLSQSAPNLRGGAFDTSISSGQRISQEVGGVTSGNSAISGSVLFNGKEINIEGLKPGQFYDENLKPITSGTSGIVDEKSTNLPGSTQIRRIASQNLAPKPALRARQGSQAGRLRTSVVSSTSTGTVSNSRTLGQTPSRSALNVRAGTLPMRTLTAQSPQAATGIISGGSLTAGTALFDGKEINIDGLKEGQLYDENLRPITPGTSGALLRNPTSISRSGQTSGISPINIEPKPISRTSQRSQINRMRTASITSSRSGTQSLSNIRAGSLSSGGSPAQGLSQVFGGARTGETLTSGTALFDGKEISIDGFKEGQLYDENLRPIMTGTSGTLLRNPGSLSTSGQISGISPISVEPKPISRTSQRSQINRMRTASITSSRSGTQSLSNIRAGSLSSGGSPAQGLSQVFGGARTGETLRSGTVLLNGKEVNLDGLKEGQLYDENLRPITSAGYAGSIRSSNIANNAQRSSSTRNLRTGTSSATSILRSQATGGSPAASGSLNFIDVTRTDESSSLTSENLLGSQRLNSAQINAAQRISSGGASAYANQFGSRSGSKVTQDRITPEISQYGVDTPIQESILNIPDDPFNKASSIKSPSVSRQSQLKVDDIFEQSSIPKLDILRSGQVQETIPFSTPESSKKISKKTLTNIAQISQKDIDIPTVQQKLLEDFPGYLPKTSFLPPFNYALPQRSTYSVKSPVTQQKVEQIFV